jgi:predicted DNA binding CopG/RHH family protein
MANKKVKLESKAQEVVSQGAVAVSEPDVQKAQIAKTEKKTALRAAKSVAAQPTATEKGFKAKSTRAKKAESVEAPNADPETPETTEKPAKSAKLDKAEKAKIEKLDKADKAEKSEKPAKMKRLTLDVSKSLHKAIKVRAVEEGMPMADMLRSLLEQNYAS